MTKIMANNRESQEISSKFENQTQLVIRRFTRMIYHWQVGCAHVQVKEPTSSDHVKTAQREPYLRDTLIKLAFIVVDVFLKLMAV